MDANGIYLPNIAWQSRWYLWCTRWIVHVHVWSAHLLPKDVLRTRASGAKRSEWATLISSFFSITCVRMVSVNTVNSQEKMFAFENAEIWRYSISRFPRLWQRLFLFNTRISTHILICHFSSSAWMSRRNFQASQRRFGRHGRVYLAQLDEACPFLKAYTSKSFLFLPLHHALAVVQVRRRRIVSSTWSTTGNTTTDSPSSWRFLGAAQRRIWLELLEV